MTTKRFFIAQTTRDAIQHVQDMLNMADIPSKDILFFNECDESFSVKFNTKNESRTYIFQSSMMSDDKIVWIVSNLIIGEPTEFSPSDVLQGDLV